MSRIKTVAYSCMSGGRRGDPIQDRCTYTPQHFSGDLIDELGQSSGFWR